MKKNWVMGLAVVALVGCSSSPKPVPVVERLEERQKAMEKSDKLLTDAQKELTNFAKKVGDLKEESDKSAAVANKARFDTSLDHLLLAVQRSQIEMRELQARNTERRRNLDARLNRAMEPGAQPSSFDEDIFQAD